MDKIQIEDLISENMKKMEKKREKAGLPPQKITNQAHQTPKNINKIEKGSSNTNVETRAKKVEEAYRDKDRWAKMALLNTASCGKFSSDRTIQEYVDDIWHLDKVTVEV